VSPLDSISDQDLLDRLRRRGQRLTSIYLSCYLVGPLVALLAWRPLGPFPAAALGFGVLLCGVIAVHLVARRLTASRLDLLAFERGLHVRLSPEAVERLTTQRLEGVECVLLLQGMALPRGGMVSVVLRAGDTTAEIETRATSFSAPGVKLKRSPLPLERIQGLLTRVRSGLGTLAGAERFPVRDGFPCELAIRCRDARLRRFVCNLADPAPDREIVRIARELWALAAPLIELPWVVERSEPPAF
jgi:hypothetical protein